MKLIVRIGTPTNRPRNINPTIVVACDRELLRREWAVGMVEWLALSAVSLVLWQSKTRKRIIEANSAVADRASHIQSVSRATREFERTERGSDGGVSWVEVDAGCGSAADDGALKSDDASSGLSSLYEFVENMTLVSEACSKEGERDMAARAIMMR